MRVTLNVFSGRPNPIWSLPPQKSAELVERLSVAGPPVAPHQPPTLGFRGFTVEADLEDLATHPSVPARFLVPAPAVVELMAQPLAHEKQRASAPAAHSQKLVAEAHDISQWLLSTAPDVVDRDAVEAADAAIRQRPAPATTPKGAAKAQRRTAKPPDENLLARAFTKAACEPFLTPVQDAFWNLPLRRFSNNCYNYASNFASNTMSQPGRRSGHMYTGFTCENVFTAAQFDGYLPVCNGTVRVVALAIWPGFDFHWWRLHPNGFWAHKIGTSMVMHVDNQNRILGNGLTPENCNRGPYTQFCSFFFGPLGVEVM